MLLVLQAAWMKEIIESHDSSLTVLLFSSISHWWSDKEILVYNTSSCTFWQSYFYFLLSYYFNGVYILLFAILGISDGEIYSGVELTSWTFQWDLTL